MRFASAAIAGFCTLPLLTGTALAQNEERYRLERTENGYVRMDTETGTMTLCQERGGNSSAGPLRMNRRLRSKPTMRRRCRRGSMLSRPA